MIRIVAALLCVGIVAYLFWRELRRGDRERISWAPFVWMFIAGSRFVSGWLNLRTPDISVSAYAEGSAVDRNAFLLLIIWGAVVLSRRNIDWRRLLRDNKWLAAYLAYCLVSIFWSDEPVILAKRWFKDLGNPIMALVLLTEHRPYDAIVTTIRRLAYVILPVSVLFIRYFPEFGRGYGMGGEQMYTGIANQKNTLGLFCLIAGVCYVWRLWVRRAPLDRVTMAALAMIGYLLFMSNSKTSLACLVLGIAILYISRLPYVTAQPTRLITLTVCGALVYAVLDSLVGLQDYVLHWLGRDPTLTNRTEVWAALRGLESSPVVGAGFMSFWTGERMAAAWAAVGGPINQAHNGYLEQYLNLGYIGVAFIIAIAIAALTNVREGLASSYAPNVLRLCFITIAMLYNYTEASFYGINNMWVLLLAGTFNICVAEHKIRADLEASLQQAPRAAVSLRRAALSPNWNSRRHKSSSVGSGLRSSSHRPANAATSAPTSRSSALESTS